MIRTALFTSMLSILQLLLVKRYSGYASLEFFIALVLINLVLVIIFTDWVTKAILTKADEDRLEEQDYYDNKYMAADPTVQVAHETLPFMRRGLTEATARQTAEIIQKICEVPAVAITDTEKVLAYLGAGCENHRPGDKILTKATQYVIETGEHKIVRSVEELNCTKTDCDCPLSAGVIAPLKYGNEVVGSLKLYQTEHGQLPPHVVRLTIGLAQLLSMQMELSELDHQSQLAAEAKLEALHSQINPHFLFNTLNTIIMYSRRDPDKTRQLLIHLAEFFRKTLKRPGHFIPLSEELDCVRNYFVLEEARFGDKIKLIEDIDSHLLDYRIPVFSLQPLVENAVKHGITAKNDAGTITIRAKLKDDELHLSVIDDGVGIPPEKLEEVLQPGYGSGTGVGLSNVHLRLQNLYGDDKGLNIISTVGKGTKIHMEIPINGDADTDLSGSDSLE